jgi:EAL domain-containing protein (putative c-di-GMP-specific phosphodiesterase class I)/CHASE2 domain-containing sensor protein
MTFRGVRASPAIILAVAALLGMIMLVPFVGGPIDRALDPLRFSLHTRQASGTVTVVEMDAASAAAIQRYPWPRRNYAAVVDALRRAGAAAIVFDVDFSSASTPEDDRLLAQAFARAGGIVALPTFAQAAGDTDARSLDALPIRAFRDHVALASVSILPDPDGIVRSMPLATMTANTPRPSLSAYIANRSGSVDQPFPIDLSIDPTSIPRLSFAAVRDGRFDAAAVRGKTILIGATAIEMGDRYAVPRWGVIPGVIVQALAAETLLSGIPVTGSGFVPFIAALLLGMCLLWRGGTIGLTATAAGAIVAIVGGVLVAQYALRIDYPVAAALTAIGTVVFGCVIREIARRFRVQRQVDEETTLPNRVAFLRRRFDRPATVAVLQVHNLDTIGSVLGAGELKHAIIRTAERLKLASADAEVYRVRGHHLAFLVSADQPIEDIMAGLRAVLRQPLEVGGRRIDVLTSIGTASGIDPEALLADAALAAEQAHASKEFWHENRTDRSALALSLSLMSDLDDAMTRGHIEVHYQPKLALANDRVTSVEALVRWRNPERGFIGPDLFIPLAEQTGRIDALTLHIVGIVLRDLADWRACGHDVAAGINVSATLLTSRPFNTALEQMLAAADVPTSALIFEVTESAAMSEPEAAVAALRRYRELGIAVSMDDYGTGQSTLSYIQKLPLNELKIDRSFVQYAHLDANDGILVRSTIDLAHSLGLKVVAEGIEDADCLAFLRTHGCDLVQGYYISRPVPLAGLLAFLGEERRQAA